MEVNKHINFLKRRGFLIKESGQSDSEFNLTKPTPKGESELNEPKFVEYIKRRCKNENVFCKLEVLSEDPKIKENPELFNKLINSIDKIYTHLKPPKNKSADITGKFNRLISVILDNKLENQVNTFSIIADKIEDINTNDLHKALDNEIKLNKSLDNETEINDETLLDLIHKIKHKSYSEYEGSFVGDHFDKDRTGLRLSYTGGDVLLEKFTTELEYVINGNNSTEWLANHMHNGVKHNIKNGIGNLIKADLKCKKSLYDGPPEDKNSTAIIKGPEDGKGGEYVEVKKLDYAADSYLSEFFAIYKNPERLSEIVNSDKGLVIYNEVIDLLYLKLKDDDGGILQTISDNFAGIMYDNNMFIGKKDIQLYWSNKGQRTKDHRLSVRYQLNSTKINTYFYDKTKDILLSTEKTLTSLPDMKTIKSNIVENLLKEENDFDWVSEYMESLPDDPNIVALIQHFSLEEVLGEDFEEAVGTWYGNHPIYLLENGEEWVVGTETSMGNALNEYWSNYIDDIGYSELGVDLSDFVDVSDRWKEEFADEEADNYVNDMGDEELLEHSGDEEEHESLLIREDELSDEIYEIKNTIAGLKGRLESMNTENMEYTQFGYSVPPHDDEDVESLNDYIEEQQNILITLESELSNIPIEKDDLVDMARESIRDGHYTDTIFCLRDPIDCLVNEMGWYEDVTQVIDAFGWDIDEEALIEDLSQDGYESMSHSDGEYHEERVNNEYYILIRVD